MQVHSQAESHAVRRRRGAALLWGVLCHATFAIAVAMMIYAMYAGMQAGWGTLGGPWRWLANALLILQFPLLHSFLLTPPGRRWLKRLAPVELGEHLLTTTYVIIASVQVILLFTLWSPGGVIWWEAEGDTRIFLSLLYATAWLLLFKSIADAGLGLHTGTIGWRAVWKDMKPVYPPMPSSGLFRLCRQPIYVSFALTTWTVPVWTPDQLFLAVTLTCYCLVGPLFKEERFKKLYKAEFEDYRRRIPYWLPWSRRAQPPVPKRRMPPMRNDQTMYRTYAAEWWTGRHRWLRTMHNLVPPRLAYFDGVVSNWRGMSVLDLGCGGGFMAEALASRGAKVIGVDPSAPAIQAGRDHAEAARLDIDYRVGTGEAIPAPNESQDCVVVVDVFEHVADPGVVLDEIRRVLKPGGLLLFDTLNRTRLAAFVFVLLGEDILRIGPRGTHDPAKFIKPSELQAMLAKAGFEAGPVTGFGPNGLNRHFDVTFGRLPTAALMYLGYAIKRDASRTG
jgi:ubiquinone biosynthesis O-methyltransferase